MHELRGTPHRTVRRSPGRSTAGPDDVRVHGAAGVTPATCASPDVLAEWVASIDGQGVRRLSWPASAPGANRETAVGKRLVELASAAGLGVVWLRELAAHGCAAHGDLAGLRSVLVIDEPTLFASGRREARALAWLELSRFDVRLAAVATIGAGDAAQVPNTVLPGELAPARRRDLRAARQVERSAWALRRAGRRAAACRAYGHAVERWVAAEAVSCGVRALTACARLLADRGDLVGASRCAHCAVRAAAAVGGRRRSAAWCASRVERVWMEQPHWPAGTPRLVAWPAIGAPPGRDWRAGGLAVMEDLVHVLEACYDAEDAPAMARMCAVVRDRLGAAAVGVVVTGRAGVIAGAGHHPYASEPVATRVLASPEILDPAAWPSGVEAAVPVRFGGTPIGGLCCRWPHGSSPDPSRTRALLVAAATACAPGLRAWIDTSRQPPTNGDTHGIIGESESVVALREAIRRAAAVPFPVLVEGESGSGKELVARAVHAASARRRRRFCAVNCAAISDELFEAELFGHARGAFTGAMGERPGLFEEADGGTLLLDEVGELTPRGQAKLLRVLQEGEVRRLGENAPRRVDVRIVAATNRPLAAEAKARRFRDDLRFRLDVVRIAIPPLRDRHGDIPLLLDHYWRLALERTGGRARLDETTVALLQRYSWPGNVRELQNLMATLAVRAPQRGRVRPSDLPFHIVTTPAMSPASLQSARREFDAGYIKAALSRCGGQRAEAARLLGMTRQGLSKLMARLDVETGGEAARGPVD